MLLQNHQLKAIVDAARAMGEESFQTVMPDGTTIEVRLLPQQPEQPPQHPLALLLQKLKPQQQHN
jgi:hypothetical protein